MSKRLLYRATMIAAASGTLALSGLATGAPGQQPAEGPPAEAPVQITQAEKLLFTTEHLHGAKPATELDYHYGKTGSIGQPPNESDTVRVSVASADNAKNDAQVSDRTGKVSLPSGNLPCNPVILYFLERDIGEMQALSGGQKHYFQKRVRMALADGPAVKPVTVDVAGKRTSAKEVVIQPYLKDPNADRFPKLISKRYTFIFSESVPGQVVMLKTEVPGANDDFAHPLQTETIRFEAVYLKPPGAAKTPVSGSGSHKKI